MATTLTTPIIETKTANTVQITGLYNKIEEESLEIHYITLLEDGTPYKRDLVVFKGYDTVKALYAELDVIIATGKTFEEASTELLYSKALYQLANPITI
jgi:hypothetical protein